MSQRAVMVSPCATWPLLLKPIPKKTTAPAGTASFSSSEGTQTAGSGSTPVSRVGCVNGWRTA